MNECVNTTTSLLWCKGKTSLAGIRDKVYRISKSDIVTWPTRDEANAGKYVGSFVLAAEAYWKQVDILSGKSSLKAEAQGEKPSKTMKNTLEMVYPGVNEDANRVMAEALNGDEAYIVRDSEGRWRIVGNEMFQTDTTINQDNGQGDTGTTGTTITATVTDLTAAPFYDGSIIVGYTTQGDPIDINPQDEPSGSGSN